MRTGKMKKIIWQVLLVVSLCVLMMGVAQAQAESVSGNYKYITNSDGTVEITGYTGSASSLTIPSTLAGKKVTSIGGQAFYNCESLTSVTIPGSITKIGVAAFRDCDKLAIVSMEKGTKIIGDYAFRDCPSLTKVSLPSTLTNIKSYAFWNCEKLEDISLPSSLTEINTGAFKDCSALTSIVIPAKVAEIGNESFSKCTALNTLEIKNGVTKIGYQAFYQCNNLLAVTIPGSVTTIDNYAFYKCDKLTTVVLGNGVQIIGYNAFNSCPSLASISLPNSLTSIKPYAFSNCTKLRKISLPVALTEIGTGAFQNCSSLELITIPTRVSTIGYESFKGCSKLALVVINEGVNEIDYGAFANCPALDSIKIPESVDTINKYAFDKTDGFIIKGYNNTAAKTYYNTYYAEKGLTFTTLSPEMYISDTSIELAVGKKYTLLAKNLPAPAQAVTWTSSDKTIATVSASGVVTAVKQGTVTITAKANGLSAKCVVKVLFKDVVGSSNNIDAGYVYYYAPVYWAAEKGITSGYSDGTFGIGKDCDRKSLMIFLWRQSGCPAPKKNAQSYFNDLKSYSATSDTNRAIAWAYENGITKGYSDGGFHPTAPVVRKDTMIMLYRVAGKPAVTGTLGFKDCTSYKASSDTYKAILWGSQNGITNGYTGNVFKPDDNCLREQIVTFIYRYSNLK